MKIFLEKFAADYIYIWNPRAVKNRVYQMWFHPSVERKYINPSKLGNMPRYPSPGSCLPNDVSELVEHDYKTPFQYSRFNVRAAKSENTFEPDIKIVYSDPVEIDDNLTLKKLGLLRKGEEKNETKVAEAKEAYFKMFGKPIGEKLRPRDPMNSLAIHQVFNWQELLEAQANCMQMNRLSGNNQTSDRSRYYDQADQWCIESLDYYVDPSDIQTLIECDYLASDITARNIELGFIPTQKGQHNYWKALDQSKGEKAVKEVQEFLRDPSPLDFTLRELKVELLKDENGKVVDYLPPKQ